MKPPPPYLPPELTETWMTGGLAMPAHSHMPHHRICPAPLGGAWLITRPAQKPRPYLEHHQGLSDLIQEVWTWKGFPMA